MNLRMTARYACVVLRAQAVFMLVPMFFSLAQGEQMAARGFFAGILVSVIGSLLLGLVHYDTEKTTYIKDGFAAVAISWIIISLTGALPFWISREIPHFVDALFESVSGFTTTGASILPSVSGISRGLLLWRSFSHWIGGMGVLVFLLALLPSIAGSGERTLNVMKAESPGPAPGKLVPKLRQSSKILYIIYLILTVLQFLFLIAGGMPVFDSIVNAMATAGTGGFAVQDASIAAYNSAYLEGVITVFMFLFGVNFNIYYFLLVKNFSAAWKSEELRAYFGIVVTSIIFITINITGVVYQTIGQSFRYSSFQVVSVMTTTGFGTTDFNLWPTFSKVILFVLMFIGGSAGSTAGGLKVSRVLILFQEIRRILFRIVHPRSVEVIKLDGKVVDKVVVHSVNAYFTTFMFLFFASILAVSLNGFDFETTITSVIACLNNIGPGLGMVGPAGHYGDFSAFSKLVLTLDMLLGRLEIYPILLLLSPRNWRSI